LVFGSCQGKFPHAGVISLTGGYWVNSITFTPLKYFYHFKEFVSSFTIQTILKIAIILGFWYSEADFRGVIETDVKEFKIRVEN
jgi:hypothetical protein